MPILTDACEWLQSLPLSQHIAESFYLFPVIETVHVLALTMVVGSIAIVDLRLLGLASRSRRLTVIARDLLPLTWGAFALALVSGLLMFASKATTYIGSTPFQLKLVALALAGLNMAVFHLTVWRRVGLWDASPRAPAGARFAGAASLTLWLGIVACGRWIGFTI